MTNIHDEEIPELKLAITDGGTISYREAGRGNALSLFLLHGMNGNSKSWINQFHAFADSYRVIAWDAPGYGQSDPVGSDADMYAAQANRLLNHLGVGPVCVVGHSMGGVVAARFCAQYIQRVKCLVLSGTHWGNAAPPDAPLASKYARRLQDLEQLSAKEYGEARAQKMLSPSPRAEVFEQVAEIAAETRREGLLNAGRMVEKTDNRLLLGSLNIPVLILTGESDLVVKPQRSEAMMEYLPNAGSVTLQGVGHAPYLEEPDSYNQAIRKFFDAVQG